MERVRIAAGADWADAGESPGAGDASGSDLAGGIAEPAARARLDSVFYMSPELRGPLHAMLGHLQLLQLEGGLSEVQSQHVATALQSGMWLLEALVGVLELADPRAEPSAWHLQDDCQPPSSLEEPRALRVLVADDGAVNRDIAAAFLRAAGHAVTLAEDGQAAVSLASTEDFDVILMDVRMPRLGGLQAARHIRALQGPRGQIPIVAVTALTCVAEVQDCREADMNAHLAKPFRRDTLLTAIARAVAGARGVSAPAAANWIEIESPWSKVSGPALPVQTPAGERQFLVRLSWRELRHLRVGPDTRSVCEPQGGRNTYEFHWLLYIDPDADQALSFRSNCDLWRWSQRSWRSLQVPGAIFSPAEMHAQGWRYCGPCPERSARVVVVAEPERPDAGWAPS